MTTINLGFTNGKLTSVVSNGPWNANYFSGGQLFTSVGEGAGHYTVTDLGSFAQTTITPFATLSPVLYSSHDVLVFTDLPVGAVATPEASTWLMLLFGFAAIAYKALHRRKTVREPFYKMLHYPCE